MISDLDIWRSARVMLKRFGDRAALEADERAGDLIEKGDQEGAVIWRRIHHAIVLWENAERGGPAN